MISALGASTDACWRRLVAGENGIGPITYFDASQYGCTVAAEVRNVPFGGTGLESIRDEHCRRSVGLFLGAVG